MNWLETFAMALLCGLLVFAGEIVESSHVAGWVLAGVSAFAMGFLFARSRRATQ